MVMVHSGAQRGPTALCELSSIGARMRCFHATESFASSWSLDFSVLSLHPRRGLVICRVKSGTIANGGPLF